MSITRIKCDYIGLLKDTSTIRKKQNKTENHGMLVIIFIYRNTK